MKYAIAALMMSLGVCLAQTTTTDYTFTLNQVIPDANATGISLGTNLTGMAGSISKVTVGLDITGGFNGDLYAYLTGPNGGFAVLLNRTGVTTGNSSGYFDQGFNVTLDDSASYNSIHSYQSFSYTLIGGQLTSIWATDGENVDPLGSSVGVAGPTATLLSLNGTNPNGNWTFFAADLSGGGSAILNNITLSITTVPEPQSWALGLLGIPALLVVLRRKDGSR